MAINYSVVSEDGGYLSGHPFIAKPFRTKDLTKRIEDVLSVEAA
jgi:hypothetical protein